MSKSITKIQLHLMAHTLGGFNQNEWHRNHFYTDDKTSDYVHLCDLESKGFMYRTEPPSFCPDGILFRVTEEGKGWFRP